MPSSKYKMYDNALMAFVMFMAILLAAIGISLLILAPTKIEGPLFTGAGIVFCILLGRSWFRTI